MDRVLAIKLLCRATARYTIRDQQFHNSVRHLTANDSSSSSSSSDSDTEKKNKKKVPRVRDDAAKQATKDLLNNLLNNMSEERLAMKAPDLALPKRKPRKKVKEPTLEEKITVAAKEVAQQLGGDTKKSEEELLDKIFSAGRPAPSLVEPKKKKTSLNEVLSDITVNKPQVAEAPPPPVAAEPEKVAEPMTKSKTKRERIKDDQPVPSLSELLAGMKIDRTPKKVDIEEGLSSSRKAKIQKLAQQFQARGARRDPAKFKMKSAQVAEGKLFSGKRLEIFTQLSKVSETTSKLSVWEALEDKDLKMLITHPPENIFEEMIQWTERGILWRFPIDNEYGLDKEQSVHFSEHVFVEQYLESWCPSKGPIRQFMELVCVGLSKNPYMTVEEKKEHIMWYRDYFGDKQELLKEIGVIEKDILPADSAKKQIPA